LQCSTPISYTELESLDFHDSLFSVSSGDSLTSTDSDDDVPVCQYSKTTRSQFSTRILQLQSKNKMTEECVNGVLSLIQDLIPSADLPSYIQIQSRVTVDNLFHFFSCNDYEFYTLAVKHQISLILTHNFPHFSKDSLDLLFFTDGAPLIKSAYFSFWPIFLVLIDLPQSVRFQWRNMVMAGVWFAKKPEWNLFLPPVLQILNATNDIEVDGRTINIRLNIRGLVADLPARASILNTKQFNGRFSCLFCEIEGESINFCFSLPK
jgi:hypothetical protein